MIGLIPGHLAADGLAYRRVRTVAAHNVLGTNDALVAFSVFYRDSNWVLPFFAYFEANESPAVIRGDARRALLGKAGKVIQDACLVHNQVRKLGDSKLIIQWTRAADNVVRVLRVLVPEGHLRDLISFIGDFGSEAKSLESFNGAGLDAICLTEFQAMRATLNQASVDVREHRKLCRGNHARGAGAHNEHIHFIGKFFCAVHAVSLGGQDAWIFRYVAIVVKLHVALLVHDMSDSITGGYAVWGDSMPR